MTCPKCNTENPDNARFCIKCGHKLKPGNPDGCSRKSKAKGVAQRLFGFERFDKTKHLKSPTLNELEVVASLARLSTDVNWLKRLVWIVVFGEGASHLLS